MKEEKFKEKNNSHKIYLFNAIYAKKVNSSIQSNQMTINKSKRQSILKSRHISLDDYIDQIKKKYEEDPIYFESMNKTNNKYHYLFSFCFFCQKPVVACDDKVICINGCFNIDVPTEDFNNDYTLDKFLDEHYEFSSDHLICNGDIIPIYVDNEEQKAFFICTKCDKDIFSRAGIEL